jgi:hypothetical protein
LSVPAKPPKPQSFPGAVVNPMATIPVPAVPGLAQSTNAQTRLTTIAAGRPDPFAAITGTMIVVPVSTKPKPSTKPLPVQQKSPATAANPPAKPSDLPAQSTPLPPATASNSTSSVPTVPPSQTAMAEAIEISGAVQVQGKWHIIVKESSEATSRHVTVGDYLANGQVVVKRILGGSNPIVVLQQNGVEVTRSIGTSRNQVASR